MCGIVGMHAGTQYGFVSSDKDQLKQMLVVNSLRGAHSTGLFGIDRKITAETEVNIVKSVGSPYMLFDWGMSDRFFSRMVQDFGTVVGHGRYATMGDISAATAHPFQQGDITLVHNGVIDNYSTLKDYKKHKDITVDSQLVAQMINDEGAEEVLPYLKGAYALVWFDNKDFTLHIARNDARPLYLGVQEGKNILQFASEAETLAWNAARSKEKMRSIELADSFRHMIFPMGDIKPREVKAYQQHVVQVPVQKHYPGTHPLHAEDEDDGYSVSNIVPIKERHRVKQRQKEASPEETRMLHLTERSEEVSIGKPVKLTITDFRQSGHNSDTVFVDGECDELPNVEFTVASHKHNSDAELTMADYVEAEVASIYYVDQSSCNNKQHIKAYVNNAWLCTVDPVKRSVTKLPMQSMCTEARKDSPWDVEKPDEDTFVSITNMDGQQVNLPAHRFRQMLDQKCAWCAGHFTAREEKDPSTLLLAEDKDTAQIVCSDCAEGWFSVTRNRRSFH